jgi:phosphatidylglycerol lysyltransferase
MLPGSEVRARAAELLEVSDDWLLHKHAAEKGFSLGSFDPAYLEPSTLSPPWTPVVRYLYEHGEGFYNFQGLRACKEKFDPEWEPRYLAYPGRLALARVVADVSALIAGGYRRIFFKAS